MGILRGKKPEPFLFRTLGEFVNLGHQSAVAQIKFLKFSGIIAWLMWRTTYLIKIPHWSRKVRVVNGWTSDFLFGRTAVESETPRLLRNGDRVSSEAWTTIRFTADEVEAAPKKARRHSACGLLVLS